MSRPTPPPDLDWQLRRAADNLRRTTTAVPVGPPPTPRRRARRIAAAAALVLLAVVSAALIWRNDRNREPRVTTGPPDAEVAPLILDPPPPGMTVQLARDLPTAADGQLTLTVYRGSLAFDGNAAVDLGIAVMDEGDTLRTEDGSPVTVRGRPGAVDDAGPFGGPTVTWEEAGHEITLASHTLDSALLLDIAEGVQVAGTAEDTAVELGALPTAIAQLSPIARLEDVDVANRTGVTLSHSGHVVEYASDGASLSIVVVVVAGDTQTLDVMTWAADADQRHDADGRTIYTDEDADGTVTAIWQEDDGAVVQVAASGTNPADLVALIDHNLREATQAEWQAVMEDVEP